MHFFLLSAPDGYIAHYFSVWLCNNVIKISAEIRHWVNTSRITDLHAHSRQHTKMIRAIKAEKAIALYRKGDPNDSWQNSSCMCSRLSNTGQSLANFASRVPISGHSTPHHCHQSSRCASSLPLSLPTEQASTRKLKHRAGIIDGEYPTERQTDIQHEDVLCAVVTPASWMYHRLNSRL